MIYCYYIGREMSEQQDRKMTVLLLIITFTFLLLVAMQCITQCFYMLEYRKHQDLIVWYRVDKSFAFGKLGVVINSSINCVFYCFFGSSFRKELRTSIMSSFKSLSFKSNESSCDRSNSRCTEQSSVSGIDNSGIERDVSLDTKV